MPSSGVERDPGALRRAIAVLTLVWAVLFAPQLFGRQVFALGDARVYRPFAEYSRERWLAGHQRTFWNPYVMAGLPASASLADMRPQYLPDAALDLFERVRPGRWVPLAAPLVAHLAGMCAVAALAWTLWRLPMVALAWAGLAWGLSPLLLVPLAFGHTAYVVAASLLPLQLLALERACAAGRARDAAGAGLLLAGVTGLQALTGHPQVVGYAAAVVVAFALAHAVRARRAWPLLLALAALAWGAALAMAVWWPAVSYGAHSVRGGVGVRIEAVRGMSIAWRDLPAFFLPRAVGGWGPTYWGGIHLTDYPRFFGTSVVLFALLGAWRGRTGGAARGPRRALLAGVVLVAVMMAFGPRLEPVYLAMRAGIPLMAKFWVASMVLVVAALAMALLSAAGLARALEHGRLPRPAWLLPALLCAGGAALLLAGVSAYAALAQASLPGLPRSLAEQAARAAGTDMIARGLLLAALFAVLAAGRRLPAALAGAALVAVVAADVAEVSYPTLRRATAPESELTAQAEPELARIGRREPAARVLSARLSDVSHWQTTGLLDAPEMRTNDWIRWGAHAHGGEHGTPPAVWQETAFLGSIAALRALGVVYVSSPPDVPQDTAAFERVAAAPGEQVYRLRGALSRAYAVPQVVALGSEPDVARAMLADGFDPARRAYTTERDAAGDYPGSAACRIRWRRDEPDTLALEVEGPGASFVVVADTWFPGWSATLDGRPAPIRRVDYAVRGVAVPPGRHELRMTFHPEGWSTGLPVTRAAGAAWLLCAAWFALGRFRRRGAAARSA